MWFYCFQCSNSAVPTSSSSSPSCCSVSSSSPTSRCRRPRVAPSMRLQQVSDSQQVTVQTSTRLPKSSTPWGETILTFECCSRCSHSNLLQVRWTHMRLTQPSWQCGPTYNNHLPSDPICAVHLELPWYSTCGAHALWSCALGLINNIQNSIHKNSQFLIQLLVWISGVEANHD